MNTGYVPSWRRVCGRHLSLTAVLLLAAGVLSACGSSSSAPPGSHSPRATPSRPPVPASHAKAVVTIKNYKFGPAALTVAPGTTVIWTNTDADNHTVTADQGSGFAPNSNTLGQNSVYRFTFSHAGRFTYHCAFHPFMHGTVVVR